MKKIPDAASLWVYEDHLIYTEAALLASAETKPLAQPVTELLDRLEALWGRERSTRRATVQASALATFTDLNLDLGIRGLQNDTLHAVVQDRKHPTFQLLFPSPLSALIRFALARQVEVTTTLVERLAHAIVPAALREKHTPLLGDLITRGREVLDLRQKAAFERVAYRFDRNAFKAECNALRTVLYSDLLKLGVANSKGKAWAEAFFLTVEASTAQGSDEEPALPDPVLPPSDDPQTPPTPA